MGESSTPRRDMEWDCLDERLDGGGAFKAGAVSL